MALLAGGTLALGSHGTKASIRMTANASPEPFSNIFLSIAEDIFTIGLAALAAFHPVMILVIILLFILLLVRLGPKIFRAIRRMLRELRAILGRTDSPSAIARSANNAAMTENHPGFGGQFLPSFGARVLLTEQTRSCSILSLRCDGLHWALLFSSPLYTLKCGKPPSFQHGGCIDSSE